MDKRIKSPTEKFPLEVNFSNDFASDESIASYTLTCVNVDTGASSSSEIVDSQSSSGDIVTLVLKAGALNDIHKLSVKATSDLANVFEKDFWIEIKNKIEGEFTKQVNEEFLIKCDFEEDLRNLTGETIASSDLEIFDETETDVEADILVTDSLTEDDDFIYFGVQAGTRDKIYLLHPFITTTSGYVFDMWVRMLVKEF